MELAKYYAVSNFLVAEQEDKLINSINGKYLPILGDNEKTANFNYVKHIVLDIDAWRLNFAQYSNKKIGEKYGLEWAEHFHYINHRSPNRLEQFIKDHAVPL